MITLKIKGMSCQHCVGSVQKALEEIAGLSEVRVDLEAASATFVNNGVDLETIKNAVKQIGFELEE
ncbi:MAG: heavy-metal-associated domain-containing protein [Desulfobulbaceae bacterium]|nr:heavy-metal-associated domain-containing protein [Desulfobulbaceae bacterium]